MAETFTPYPPSQTGRRPGITGHSNVSETQEHQGPRPLASHLDALARVVPE